MADASITLTQSQSSSSSGVTYRGYVINLCDNSKVDDGDWDYDSVTGITASTNTNKITIWNTNTTDSSVSATFTWTSSKVDGCTKTLSVTAEGAVVTLKSGNTEIVVTAYYSTSTGGYSIYSYQDEFLINESSNGILTTSNTVSAAPVITCNGGMSEYWINYAQNNTDNKIHVSVNPNMSTYFVGCTGDYTATGTNTINLKYYEREMSISFPVTFKFICSANYKFYHKEFFSSEEISGWSESHTIYNGHTYSLNEIIEGQLLACAESPNDNSVSASLLTVSNFSSNNSNFTFSSLAINDNDDPSGFFYIGVKCNTNSLVNLFNGDTGFSATMTFDLSYSNASIPVTININKGDNVWYKYEGGSLVEITELNKNKISLPETMISEIIVFSQNNNYITDTSKYSYEQTTGDLTINLSFEPRPISSSIQCMGIKISATDVEMDKLYENNSSIIMLPNVSGNIICEENYKLPISFTFETPFRIHILNSKYETFPDIIQYIEFGLIEKENFGNTSGIYKTINESKMHYNMYRYNTDSDNTRYKYIFVDIYYHTGDISNTMLQCAYPPASSSVIARKSYPENHTDNIDNLRIVIPHNTDTEYLADFVFTATK